MKTAYIIFLGLSMALFALRVPARAGEIEDLKAQIEQREQEIQQFREQAKQYQQNIVEKKDEADTLEDAVIGYNRQIQSLQNEISINQKQITSLSLQITKTELQISAQEEAIARNKEHIASLLREMYARDDESVLELVLKYENFSDFYNQIEFRNVLGEELQTKLNEIQLFRRGLQEEQQNLENEKLSVEGLKRDLAARKDILEDQRQTREKLLRSTRNEEYRYQQMLADVQEKERDVNLQIFELEDRLRRALDPNLVPKAIPGALSWPADGRFTQGYGCIETKFARRSYPSCNNGAGGFHNGADIAAPLGAPISAARDGKVIAVENAPYAYGKWVAIEHDNGLVTAYTHLSNQLVGVGQEVKRGDVVGYMGSTGYSTGSHVHFMVYAPKTFTTQQSKLSGILPIGATLNPLDYLPQAGD